MCDFLEPDQAFSVPSDIVPSNSLPGERELQDNRRELALALEQPPSHSIDSRRRTAAARRTRAAAP